MTLATRSPSGCTSTTSSPPPCSTTTVRRAYRSRWSTGWATSMRYSGVFGGPSEYPLASWVGGLAKKLEKRASESDLGPSMKPAVNGDQTHLEPGGEGEPEAAGAPPRIASAFPPIADYAFLSDCEVNCLIAPSGRIR